MKTQKIFKKISLGVVFVGASMNTYAGNLPNVSGLKTVAGVKIFESPKTLQWVLPFSYTSKLTCSPPEGAEQLSCALHIYNRFDTQAQSALNEIQNRVGGVITFRDIDSSVLQSYQASFDGKIRDLLLEDFKNISEPLYMDNRHSVLSRYFRIPPERYSEIMNDYSSGSLGVFSATVRMNVEQVNEYLEVSNLQKMKHSLTGALGKKLKFSEAYSAIEKAVENADLKVKSYQIPAHLNNKIISTLLTSSLVQKNLSQGYFLIGPTSFESLNNSEILIDATQSGLTLRCEAQVLLSPNAQNEIYCERE